MCIIVLCVLTDFNQANALNDTFNCFFTKPSSNLLQKGGSNAEAKQALRWSFGKGGALCVHVFVCVFACVNMCECFCFFREHA